ncbi:MAG: stage III sporulation protein AD [Lachnospiraceae bacterium]|nr:stage III sporulation protein AD [Lachnospiraceae bacterium]MBQ8547336.1 stage III sporulation protein AD [Lachnospiraceae bacterium]
MVKVVLIGLVAVFAVLLMKVGKPEFAMAVSLAACVLILLFAGGTLTSVIGELKKLFSYITLPEGYLKILFKILGVAYLAEFGSALCKDAGQSAVSGQIELVGKLTILAISMPVVTSLFETIARMTW